MKRTERRGAGRRAGRLRPAWFEGLEDRRLLSGAGPELPVVASIAARFDPDGNGVVLPSRVVIEGRTVPGAIVRLGQGGDGGFEQVIRAGRGGRFRFHVRLDDGLNTIRVDARAADGGAGSAEFTVLRGDAVLNWNATLLDLVRSERLTPVVATRDLALLHTAIYDAVNSIEGGNEPYAVQIAAPRWASSEAAVAGAGYAVLSELFAAEEFEPLLRASYREALSTVHGPARRDAGLRVGREAAAAILALRADDGWDAVVAHVAIDEPGHWRSVPTVPGGPTPPALAPQWGAVRPWAMTTGGQFRPDPPPALTSAEYAAAVDEVRLLGARDSAVRTADQSAIALFWSDDPGTATPPGHWNQIAAEVGSRLGNSLAENARLFALLNITTADAAIACWDAKYVHDLWRPYSAIREADTDGNPLTTADPLWEAFIFIPPFPAYTSGHSTFSGATAAILAEFFGTDSIAFTTTAEGVDMPARSFDSFAAAAQEAADSRLYGGIHFRFDNQKGQEAGIDLARYVAANFLSPLS